MSGEETDTSTGGPGSGSPEGLPDVGHIIDGKYRVEERIGLGGMGAVLRVTHLALGERYAVKCLLPKRARDPEIIGRFLREARSAARIKSEYIAHVVDVGQLPTGSPFIVMEHLAGADLAAVLKRHGPLPIHDAVDYVLQACAGVAEAHALGIIHRDLKPSNLFLTRRSDGTPLVKVLDFGIAKAVDEGDHPTDDALTATTNAFGSPGYMSPEQIRSTKNVDFRTDVWGLGVILYELIVGRKPFDAETPLAVLAAIAADEPGKVREFRPEASPELEAVIARCLEKRLSRRWASVADLADALNPFASGRVVSLGRIKRLARAPGQHPSFHPPAPSRPDTGEAVSRTDKTWTTTSNVPSPRRLWFIALGVVFVGAAGSGYLVRGVASPKAAVATAAVAANNGAPQPLLAPPPTSAPFEAAAAVAIPPLSPPSPSASTAAAAPLVTRRVLPASGPGPGRRGSRAASSGSLPMAPTTIPSTPGPKEAPPVDPTANSH